MTLGSRHGFSSKLHSEGWVSSGAIESLNVTPFRKGHHSVSQARATGGYNVEDVLSDSSKLNHCGQLLTVLTMFQGGDFGRCVLAHPCELL